MQRIARAAQGALSHGSPGVAVGSACEGRARARGRAQVTSTWRKVAPKFEGEEAFEALEKIDRLEVFQQYIRCGAAGTCAPPRDTAGTAHSASGASATNLATILFSPPIFQCQLSLSCLCRRG